MRQRALAFATAQYRHLRDFKVTPKKAYNETWKRLQRAAYGTHSEIGFIRYAHQISEIVHDAQRAVDER